MIKNVEVYLSQLRAQLAGSDSATIQDALADAEEYLRTALQNEREAHPETSEADALTVAVEAFGSPEEIAAAYKQIEVRVRPTLAPAPQPVAAKNSTPVDGFFGIVASPQAWGSLFYMAFSLLTGILYFTWAVTGLSMSLGFLILIIGLPFFAMFLLSVRGIALIEGRIVEALLGVRMPRRSHFIDKSLGWREQIKTLVTDRRTWLSIAYMLVQLPLGIFYFTLSIVLLALSLSFMVAPILQLVFHLPMVHIGSHDYTLPMGGLVLLSFSGFMLLFVTLHLARWIGRWHGAMAKAMLVS